MSNVATVRRLWGVWDNGTMEYKKYFKFVEAVANVTYSSLEVFKEFKGDRDFKNIDMLDVADRVRLLGAGESCCCLMQ